MGEIVTLERKATTIRDMMAKNQKLIESALPRHMSPDRFLRIALTSMSKNPKLLECTPRSLFGAVLQCAQLGLETDDLRGQAYLIPFRNKGVYEVQVMVGYKGFLELVYRTKKVLDITAEVVHEQDEFSFQHGSGDNEFLTHKPYMGDDPGELIAAYVKVKFAAGHERFAVLPRREVMKAASSSRAYRDNSGPWITHEDEMWKKTALRRICKTVPMSPEVATAIALEERESAGIGQDLSALIPDLHTDNEENKSGLDGLTDKLKEEKGHAEQDPNAGKEEVKDKPKPIGPTKDPEPPNQTQETDDIKADTLIAEIRASDLEMLKRVDGTIYRRG